MAHGDSQFETGKMPPPTMPPPIYGNDFRPASWLIAIFLQLLLAILWVPTSYVWLWSFVVETRVFWLPRSFWVFSTVFGWPIFVVCIWIDNWMFKNDKRLLLLTLILVAHCAVGYFILFLFQ